MVPSFAAERLDRWLKSELGLLPGVQRKDDIRSGIVTKHLVCIDTGAGDHSLGARFVEGIGIRIVGSIEHGRGRKTIDLALQIVGDVLEERCPRPNLNEVASAQV